MASTTVARDSIPAESIAAGKPDWAAEIPESKRNHLRRWMLAGAIITASTLIIGGTTRLTESGLSIVDWDPIVGAIPPLTDGDWHDAFARYQQFPEYIKVRPDMTLSEFKFIYFWEYLHRMIGRLLGVVFAIPFLWFLVRDYFNKPMLMRSILLFVLGGLQGLMGWLMVSSGLVDRPDVSHFRLAAHLSLAIAIFGFCLWFANDLAARNPYDISDESRRGLRRSLLGFGVLLSLQIVWGAFVAGMKAGLSFNTFPLMAGRWTPPGMLGMRPVLLNFLENPATVQWTHRVLATLLLISSIAIAKRIWNNAEFVYFRGWGMALAGIVTVQYIFGISTLLSHVQTFIAVIHQLTALIIVGVLLTFIHLLVHKPNEVSQESIIEPAK